MRRKQKMCERCKEVIQNRTYPSARFCKNCVGVNRKEYVQRYHEKYYLAKKCISFSVVFGMANEVKQNANRITVPVR